MTDKDNGSILEAILDRVSLAKDNLQNLANKDEGCIIDFVGQTHDFLSQVESWVCLLTARQSIQEVCDRKD